MEIRKEWIDQKAINKVKKHPLYNKRIFVSKTDAANETQVMDFFNKIKKKFRNLDALINNVGIEGPTRPIEKLDSNEWENTLHVNVNSHFYFTKQAIPLLKKSKNASIINISSVAGIMGYPLRSPYAASKWAVVGMTKTLAMELGKYKIRVNAICPGTIKGDRMKRVIRDKAKFTKISKNEMPFVAQTVVMGGNPRVGLEDNLYLSKGKLATNAQLVEKAIRIVNDLGVSIMTPAETREKLKLKNYK